MNAMIALPPHRTPSDHIRLPGSRDLIARVENGAPEYVHADHLSSVVAQTNGWGAVDWRESYMPVGAPMVSTAHTTREEVRRPL